MGDDRDNRSYYRQRFQTSLEAALRAASPSIRTIHLEMAAKYEELAENNPVQRIASSAMK